MHIFLAISIFFLVLADVSITVPLYKTMSCVAMETDLYNNAKLYVSHIIQCILEKSVIKMNDRDSEWIVNFKLGMINCLFMYLHSCT